MMIRIAEALQRIAVTLWVGGLWVVGFVVAPALFHSLEDRSLAGSLAGELFTLIAWIGLACGGFLLFYGWLRSGSGALTQVSFWIVAAMTLLVAAGQFGVHPVVEGLRARALAEEATQAIARERFAAWHGVAVILYMIESVLGLALVLLPPKGPN